MRSIIIALRFPDVFAAGISSCRNAMASGSLHCRVSANLMPNPADNQYGRRLQRPRPAGRHHFSYRKSGITCLTRGSGIRILLGGRREPHRCDCGGAIKGVEISELSRRIVVGIDHLHFGQRAPDSKSMALAHGSPRSMLIVPVRNDD